MAFWLLGICFHRLGVSPVDTVQSGWEVGTVALRSFVMAIVE